MQPAGLHTEKKPPGVWPEEAPETLLFPPGVLMGPSGGAQVHLNGGRGDSSLGEVASERNGKNETPEGMGGGVVCCFLGLVQHLLIREAVPLHL